MGPCAMSVEMAVFSSFFKLQKGEKKREEREIPLYLIYFISLFLVCQMPSLSKTDLPAREIKLISRCRLRLIWWQSSYVFIRDSPPFVHSTQPIIFKIWPGSDGIHHFRPLTKHLQSRDRSIGFSRRHRTRYVLLIDFFLCNSDWF